MRQLKEALKPLYFKTHEWLGTDRRLLSQIQEQGRIPILNLHRVSKSANHFWNPMPPERFEELLTYLKANFRILTFADLEQERTAASRKRPWLILSFDDGFLDFYQNAMPILRKHDIRVNMNVIPEAALTGEAPWNVRLYDFLDEAPLKLIHEIKLPGFSRKLKSKTASDQHEYGFALSCFLKLRPRAEREPLWAALEPLLKKIGHSPTRSMMNLAELRESAEQHELGAHSFSHESMGYETAEYFEADFEKCADFFLSELKQPLLIYAFPNGSYRPEQIDFLLKKGLKRVLLVDEELSTADTRVHRRLTIGSDSTLELRFQALGFRTKAGIS